MCRLNLSDWQRSGGGEAVALKARTEKLNHMTEHEN